MRYLALAALLSFAPACFAGSAAPVVASLTPNFGAPSGGTIVAIGGSGFTGVTAVNFGVTPAQSFTFNDDTSISATSPPGVNPVAVTVTTQFGTNATGQANLFTYVTTPVTLQSFNVD